MSDSSEEIETDLLKEKNLEVNKKKKRAAFISISTLLLATLAVIHIVKTRSSSEFWKYSFYTAIATGIIFLVVGIISWASSRFSKLSKEDISIIFLAPFFLVIAGILYYSIGASIKDIYMWIQSPSLSKTGAITLVIIVTIILGSGLFYFRLRLRSIYGITEALVGLAVAANRVSSENDKEILKSQFYLAILTASVYLVVRGLDNVHQGLTKDPKDPIAAKAFEFFKRISTPNSR